MTTSKQDKPDRRPQATGSVTQQEQRHTASDGGQYAGSDAADAPNSVQGEGNYDAAREYDDAQRTFVESGRVERAAHEAAPGSADEARQMEEAEREGKSHSKGEDAGEKKRR